LENVIMAQQHNDVISQCLGEIYPECVVQGDMFSAGRLEPIEINSALVSAQNRRRLYWTNIPNITQPDDKGILLKDIIEGIAFINNNGVFKIQSEKANCIDANYHKGIDNHGQRTMIKDSLCIQVGTADINGNESIKRICSDEGKCPTLTAVCGGNQEPKIACCIQVGKTKEGGFESGNRIYSTEGKNPSLLARCHKDPTKITDNNITWRKLTPVECERLQTVPDNYTAHVSNSRRYHALGNSFTVDVIVHILKQMEV
jgi:site-specific DNA-cytosine methylase